MKKKHPGMSPRKLCKSDIFWYFKIFQVSICPSRNRDAGHAQSIAPCYPHWWMVKVTFRLNGPVPDIACRPCKALIHMGVSIVMGLPLYRWMVLIREILLKWMITRGTPIYGNLQIDWCQFLGRAASSYAHSLYRLIMFDSLHSRQPSKLPHLNAAQALGHKEQAAPNLSQCARQKTSLILQPENLVCPKKTRHDTSHRKKNRRCQSLQLFWIQVGWRNPLWQHLESHVGSFVYSYILQNVFGTLQPSSFWITKAWNKSRSTSAMRRNAKKMSTVWSCSAGHDWLCSTLRSWLWSHLGSLHPLRWLRWLHWLYCFPLHCEFRGFAVEWPTFPTQSGQRRAKNLPGPGLMASAKFCEILRIWTINWAASPRFW